MREQAKRVDPVELEGFELAERVILNDTRGSSTPWVILAVANLGGRELAYVVREEELGEGGAGMVCSYTLHSDGSALLSPLGDDDEYDGALHAFQDLFDDEDGM